MSTACATTLSELCCSFSVHCEGLDTLGFKRKKRFQFPFIPIESAQSEDPLTDTKLICANFHVALNFGELWHWNLRHLTIANSFLTVLCGDRVPESAPFTFIFPPQSKNCSINVISLDGYFACHFFFSFSRAGKDEVRWPSLGDLRCYGSNSQVTLQ